MSNIEITEIRINDKTVRSGKEVRIKGYISDLYSVDDLDGNSPIDDTEYVADIDVGGDMGSGMLKMDVYYLEEVPLLTNKEIIHLQKMYKEALADLKLKALTNE